MTFPTGRYRVVVLDPPWPIKKVPWGSRRGIPYDVMELEDIAALPVPDLLDDDAWVFCWTLSQFLPQTFGLLEGWGLRYRELMTWRKQTAALRPAFGPSYSGMKRNSEFVAVASAGSPRWTSTKNLYAAFDGLRRGHSRKPQVFDDLLRACTEGPRIELFARERKRGFDTWGDELEAA